MLLNRLEDKGTFRCSNESEHVRDMPKGLLNITISPHCDFSTGFYLIHPTADSQQIEVSSSYTIDTSLVPVQEDEVLQTGEKDLGTLGHVNPSLTKIKTYLETRNDPWNYWANIVVYVLAAMIMIAFAYACTYKLFQKKKKAQKENTSPQLPANPAHSQEQLPLNEIA